MYQASVHTMLMRFFCILLLLLTSCRNSEKMIEEHAFIMGTMVSISVAEKLPEAKVRIAIKASMQEIQRIESIFSSRKKNSVQAFNQSKANTWQVLDDEVSSLFVLSLNLMQQSHAAFYPMLGELKQLWGFDAAKPKVPPKIAIDHLVRALAQGNIIHEKNRWKRTNENLVLDFGAIAKGYAIDQAIQVLRQYGIKNAIVNAGGDMRVIGQRFGRAWRIGIKHPRHSGMVLGWVQCEGDVSLVTSGDYERFFVVEGQSYHHILDVKTGYPAKYSQSVTVMAQNATLADAWSTALFVLGAKKIKDIQLPMNIDYLIVNQHGEKFLSVGMKRLFHEQ